MRLLFTLLLAWPISWPAQAEHVPKGNPAAVTGEQFDVSNQFNEQVPTQGRTGSCSAYAAVALTEAACRRVLKKPLKLSEALPIWLVGRSHLQSGILPFGYDRPAKDQPFPVSSAEASSPGYLLTRFVRGAVCREETFSLETQLTPLLDRLRKKAAAETGAGLSAEQVEANYLKNLDAEVAALGVATRRGADFYEYETKDPALRECLDGLAPPIHRKQLLPGELKALLAQGIPVLCTALNHAFVIMGYRIEASDPLSPVWHERNSHHDRAKWTKRGYTRRNDKNGTGPVCNQAEIVVTKEEAARLKLPESQPLTYRPLALTDAPPVKDFTELASLSKEWSHVPPDPEPSPPAPSNSGVEPFGVRAPTSPFGPQRSGGGKKD